MVFWIECRRRRRRRMRNGGSWYSKFAPRASEKIQFAQVTKFISSNYGLMTFQSPSTLSTSRRTTPTPTYPHQWILISHNSHFWRISRLIKSASLHSTAIHPSNYPQMMMSLPMNPAEWSALGLRLRWIIIITTSIHFRLLTIFDTIWTTETCEWVVAKSSLTRLLALYLNFFCSSWIVSPEFKAHPLSACLRAFRVTRPQNISTATQTQTHTPSNMPSFELHAGRCHRTYS